MADFCMPENTTSPRPDPRSLWVLDVRDLGRRPGSLRTVRRDPQVRNGYGLELIGVPAGATLDLDLTMQSVTEGVLVTGTVTAPLSGECGRCLDPITDEYVAELCELFAYPDSATDETTEADEVYRIVDELIDLEPVVRDLLVLALPMTPLCRPDCGGLCPDCGQKLDELPAGHTHDTIDPRWAALAARRGEPEHATAEHEDAQHS